VVNASLTKSPQEWPVDDEELVEMTKFVLGEAVVDKGRLAIVRATFLNKEGQRNYAIELNGAINYIEEDRLAKAPASNLAA
jgi:hypothetical protein